VKRERLSCETDADVREGGRQHGAATAAEHEPERTDEFSRQLPRDRHERFPRVSNGNARAHDPVTAEHRGPQLEAYGAEVSSKTVDSRNSLACHRGVHTARDDAQGERR
jgi:hypothetical protein